MSRIALSKIHSLTLYADEQTEARRAPPVPQLHCLGTACKAFKPEVVRCYNNGGEGTEVDWTCEADLPETMRFGRVEVSCEGWDRPGDPYVLKGSCGLEYRLVDTSGRAATAKKAPEGKAAEGESFLDNVFRIGLLSLTVALVLYCVYRLLKPFFPSWSRGSGGGGGGGGSGSSQRRRDNFDASRRRPHDYPPAPPPPYSERPSPGDGSAPKAGPSNDNNSGNSSSTSGGAGVAPGFWSGLGLGGFGGFGAGRWFGGGGPRAAPYDWERERVGGGGWFAPAPAPPMGYWRPAPAPAPVYVHVNTPTRRPAASGSGSGSGPGSGSGGMRRSTGFGVSKVR